MDTTLSEQPGPTRPVVSPPWVIVLAASAGGLNALTWILGSLPSDLPAAVVVVAVVLSGTGRDAADGVQSVKAHDGAVLAQDQASAQYWGMPRAAIRTGSVDRVLPLDEIAPALVRLVGGRARKRLHPRRDSSEEATP
jgi:chemotaxis response regulator CheB